MAPSWHLHPGLHSQSVSQAQGGVLPVLGAQLGLEQETQSVVLTSAKIKNVSFFMKSS